MKLPKIDDPTFDRTILHQNTFQEQFEVSNHFKTHLTNVEKLACLRHALKRGPANQAIEGLSQSAGQYKEAVGCLKGVMINLALYIKHTPAPSSMPFL